MSYISLCLLECFQNRLQETMVEMNTKLFGFHLSQRNFRETMVEMNTKLFGFHLSQHKKTQREYF